MMAKKQSEAEVTFRATDSNLKDTVKGITNELTKNRAELKLEQAQLQLTGSESDKLGSKLTSLEKQYDLQGQKVEITSQRLQNAVKYYGENSVEANRLQNELIKQQTAQQRLSNEITKTSQALNLAKGDIQTYASAMQDLDSKQRNLQASANLVESEYKSWQATAGQTASEADKLAKAEEYVANQSTIAEQKISVMRRQLEATQTEFGSTSTEAMQMETKLNNAEREFSELGNAAKSVDTSNLQDIGSKIDMGNMMEAADILSSIGDKMIELGKQAVESANETSNAQGKIQASFNSTDQEAQKLIGTAKAIYQDGYGDSLDQVSDALVLVKRNLGDLNNQDLKNITEQAMTLETTLGSDMDETLRGANALMQAFGYDGQQSMDLIVAGTQNGLDKTHELGDNLAEYAPLFAQNGYSAEQMFTVLQAGLDSGAYNLDKVNDLVKEFGVRVADKTAIDALHDLGGGFDDIAKKLESGQISNKDAFGAITDQISKMGTEQEKAAAISAVFGSQGEDAGTKVVDAMGKAASETGELSDAYSNVGGSAEKMKNDTSGPMQELQGSIRELKDNLTPIGNDILSAAKPVVDFMSEMSEKFQTLPEPVKQFIEVLGVFAGAFALVAPIVAAVVSVISTIGPILVSAMPIIAGIGIAIAAVVAIFNNWGTISDWLIEKWTLFKEWIEPFWTPIAEFFTNIFNQIWGVIVNVWNTIQAWLTQNQTLIQNTFTTVWNAIKAAVEFVVYWFGPFIQTAFTVVQTIISTILNQIQIIFSTVWNVIKTVVSTVWGVIRTTIYTVLNAILGIIKAVMQAITGDWSGAWETIKGVGSTIWNGIKSNFETVLNGIKQVGSDIMTGLGKMFENSWNGIKNTATTIWEAIKSAITGPINSAWNTVKGIIDNIKNAFDFEWKLPEIQLPQIPTISLETSSIEILGKTISYPSGFNINWHADGGIFDRPTLLGGGHGVGEAGAEAVIPLNSKTLGGIGEGIARATSNESLGGTTVLNLQIEWTGDIDSPERIQELAYRINDEFTTMARTGYN